MSAVYKRELKSLFAGMIAPIFISILLLFCGLYTVLNNLSMGNPHFEYTVPSLAFVFLLIIPVLTMKSFAEEKSMKTDQALYSLPLTTFSVIAGKYLAMVTVLGVSALAMGLFPIIFSIYGDVYFTAAYASILGFFFMGCALIAIGMFISSLTESQVIAAVISIALFLILYLISSITSLIPETAIASFIIILVVSVLIGVLVAIMTKNYLVGVITGSVLVVSTLILYFVKSSVFQNAVPTILGQFNVFDRMSNFVYGIFDINAIVYYLSIIVLFVFFTIQSFDKKRWN